jgi:hypothetical protein
LEDKAHQKRVTLSHRYKRVFATPDGSLVLRDLMRAHYVVSNTYNKDPIEMAFNEGQRNVVLRILKLVKEDIAAIEKRISDMEKETYE